MTDGDVLLAIGLFMGFLLGIPFGVWSSVFANYRGWK